MSFFAGLFPGKRAGGKVKAPRSSKYTNLCVQIDRALPEALAADKLDDKLIEDIQRLASDHASIPDALAFLFLITIKKSPISHRQEDIAYEMAAKILGDLQNRRGLADVVDAIDQALRGTYYRLSLLNANNLPIGQAKDGEMVTSHLEMFYIGRFCQALDKMASPKERIAALTDNVLGEISYGEPAHYPLPKGFSDQPYREARARKVYEALDGLTPKDQEVMRARLLRAYPRIVQP
jgi:hypothetical protein